MEATNNYFELFDIKPAFDIDLAELKNKYQELQKAVHPDRFANASDQERLLSVQQAAMINDAYNTLRQVLGRAKYLLQLADVAYDDENNTTMDPAFLMQQMELRESIAEIKTASDPFDAIEQVMSNIEDHIRELLSALSDGFSSDIRSQADSITENIRKLQFFEKLRQEVENVESELEL